MFLFVELYRYRYGEGILISPSVDTLLEFIFEKEVNL